MNRIFLISLLVLPLPAFAFFCPTNFNQIEFGYTPEQVTQQCGTPAKTETREVKPEGPQEWSYFVPQTVATSAMNQTQGTLKTQVTFDANGKAISLNVNGIGVGSTTICGSNIQLGDTREIIRSACGKPSFINRQEPSNETETGIQPPIKITEFTYVSPNKIVKLTFENGQLKSSE